MSLAVVLVVVLVLQERVLITAVRGKRYCRDTQTREAGLEPVPSAEESRVPPVLTVKLPPSVVLIDRRGCLVQLTISPKGRSGASRQTPSACGCRSR